MCGIELLVAPLRRDVPAKNKQLARNLRRSRTVPERLLRNKLASCRAMGFPVRFQYAIGEHCIADFACLKAMLVVELDGRSHDGYEKCDLARQRWLEEQGWHVVRFTNDEVLADCEAVANEIIRVIEGRLSNPPPKPGRG